MLVSSLGMGFRMDDLKDMPLYQMQWLVHEYNAMHQSGSGGSTNARVNKGDSRMLAQIL